MHKQRICYSSHTLKNLWSGNFCILKVAFNWMLPNWFGLHPHTKTNFKAACGYIRRFKTSSSVSESKQKARSNRINSIRIKMQAQKILLFALVAGLLILQLSPLALARPRDSRSTSSSSSSTTEDSDGDSNGDNGSNGGVSTECLVSIFNFILNQANIIIPAIGLGFAACTLPCGATGTTGACVACITNAIPGIPTIPTNLAGCS